MDLAPDDKRRGAFLGVWSLSMIAGQVIRPHRHRHSSPTTPGSSTAFITVSGFLVVAGVMVAIFGVETRRARIRQAGERPP